MSQPQNLNTDQTSPTPQPPRWQFSLRDLLIFTAAASLYLAGFAVVFQNLAYRATLSIPHVLLVMVFILVPRITCKRSLGPIFVRLRRKPRIVKWILTYGWIPLLCIFITPILPTDERQVIWQMFMVLALASSALVSLVAMNRSIFLGRNGIVYDGVWFMPWANALWKTKHCVYRIDDRNVLTLGRGWLRTEAFVPPEQREAVEALLRIKLGPPNTDTQ